MTGNLLTLFPLQISVTDFNMDNTTSPTTLLIGAAVIGAIIALLIILNSRKGSGSGSKKPGGSNSGGFSTVFSGFKLRSIARNIGLSGEQTKMLEYVFKTDGVTDPEKSISTPALLDRHFRRAYRIIENGRESDKEIQRKLSILFSTRNMLENSTFGGISSSHQLKDDTALTLTFGKDKLNVIAITAKGENLIVEVPKTVLGSQIKIPRGTRLTVLFFTKSNKGFSFETRVVGYSSHGGHPAMQLAHSNQLRFLSQRRFRRKQVSIACSMYLVYVEGSGKKERLIVDKRRNNGQIMDISVGGCSIKILAPVQVGARFKIEFSQSDANVAALGQVLRSNRTGAGTIIHVRFLRVSLVSMNTINAFVYEYSRE
ncbi:MAG: PilZ domain-containing protein [Treponema sp.]|nr:PilZ domain-containing protein [Treponema sp.]